MAPATNGSNGYGSMYGDPHVIVQSDDEEAVCFKVDDQDGAVVSLIQDPQEGLAVNGGLKQGIVLILQIIYFRENFLKEKNLEQNKAGPNKVRLESLYVKSPSGLEIEIDCNWIILSRDGIQVRFLVLRSFINLFSLKASLLKIPFLLAWMMFILISSLLPMQRKTACISPSHLT